MILCYIQIIRKSHCIISDFFIEAGLHRSLHICLAENYNVTLNAFYNKVCFFWGGGFKRLFHFSIYIEVFQCILINFELIKS